MADRRLGVRRGQPPHPDEVVTGDDALDTLLLIRAEPGRGATVRALLDDEPLREALRRFCLSQGDVLLEGRRLSIGVASEAAVALEQACAFAKALRDRFLAVGAATLPAEPPVTLPTETLRQRFKRDPTLVAIVLSPVLTVAWFGLWWLVASGGMQQPTALALLVGPPVFVIWALYAWRNPGR